MQHQSQEHYQPHSSEFVPFEQPQAYQPQPPVYVPPYQQSAQKMPQFSAQGQEQIVIYPNRGQIIGRLALVAAIMLLWILLMAFISSLPFSSDSPPGLIETYTLIGTFVGGFIGLSSFVAWLYWPMISMLSPQPKPVLIINNEGIRVSRMPLQSGFFIAWSEIDAIYSATFMYKYICIRPKNIDHYLSRFHLLDRFNRRLNVPFLGAPLYSPQILMSRPVDEVIHQIYTQYWPQLNHNRIRLHQ